MSLYKLKDSSVNPATDLLKFNFYNADLLDNFATNPTINRIIGK
jgi:hypothetical protein